MNDDFRCGDGAALAGYVYEDCAAGEREAIEAHLTGCALCADDVAALRATRGALASWTPPDAQLGFRMVAADARPAAAAVAARRWWPAPVPAWAQAAAAVLVLASAAAIANLEVRYDAAGLTVRAGWAGAPEAAAPAGAASTPARAQVTTQDLAALEQRMLSELRALQAVRTPAAPAGDSSEEVIARVRALVDESERRQEREMSLRLAQMVRDLEAQRQVDLVRIERSVGQLEGLTGAEVARQRQVLNYLMRVSQRQP